LPKILLVDDDSQALDSTCRLLEYLGYEVVKARDGQAALDALRPGSASGDAFDLVLTDVRMPRMGGIELLRAISVCRDRVPVVLMTAFGRVEEAVWAMKLGAIDFLTKPFKRKALQLAVEGALKRRKTSRPGQAGETRLLGSSTVMLQLQREIEQVAQSDASILITGESGTGKELVAKQIHFQSTREKKGAFIALNCGSIPEQLIESELFGHERGSFSGAIASKKGLFEAADGGTLLLDEIGDMPVTLQTSLLRTLQEGEVRRVGATRSQKVDARVISATNRDLQQAVKEGLFREDLLFRLDVISIRVPPLRERMEDLEILAEYFLKESANRHEKSVSGFDPEALKILRTHDWPGNVRELSNVVERAVVFCRGEEITSAELPNHLLALAGREIDWEARGSVSIPLGTSLKEVEELLIKKTLEATNGDKNMTAKLLGINSRTIYRKLRERVET